jgi:tetratricopeptide (TPR) repeat protein
MRRVMGPKKGLLVLLLMSGFSLQNPVCGQTLQDAVRLYRRGELNQTKHLLLSLPSVLKEDPEVLLLLGKTEEIGAASINYLQRIINLGCDWSGSDEAQLLICKYEFCRSMYVTTTDLSGRMQRDYPNSEVISEALWLSGSAFLAMENPDSAFTRFRQIITSFPRSSWVAWAQLGFGDCFFVQGDFERAISSYQHVLDFQKDSPAFPFALSGLVECSSRMEDFEKALLYHNLLKERYPKSIESMEAIPKATLPSEEMHKEDKAERLTGVRYTIQLGVFGVKENALRLKSQYEKLGYLVRIKTQVISGKKYSVVQLGSFANYEQASDLKRELEGQTGESYRVVIR